MNLSTSARISYLATLAAGIAIGVAVAGTATAAPAAQAAKQPVKLATHHYSLTAAAFVPDGLDDAAEDYFNQWDPASLSNQDTGRCFDASLSLPTGITLKSVTIYYTGGNDVMYFELTRQDLINQTYVTLASTHTAVQSTPTYTAQKIPISSTHATVNMTGYAYAAGVCPAGNTRFTGISITYTESVS